MIRTASSSVSGSTASATRAPSTVCWSTQCRYARRVPPVASLHALDWSMTNRRRRQTSRGRPSANPSSMARRSRAIRSSSSDGARQRRSSWMDRRKREPGEHRVVGRHALWLFGEVAPAALAARRRSGSGHRRRSPGVAFAAQRRCGGDRWGRRPPGEPSTGRVRGGWRRRGSWTRRGRRCQRPRERPRGTAARCGPAPGW